MTTYFWFAAGMLVGLALAFVLVPLVRVLAATFHSRIHRYAIAAGVAVAFAAIVLIIYRSLGTPEALVASSPDASAPHSGARTPGSGEMLNSVAGAAAGLEERITRDGGSRSDWLLLAQSYDYLGKAEDAARARGRADQAPAAATPVASLIATSSPPSMTQYEERVHKDPRDVEAWRALATLYRQQRNFPAARDAFGKLIKLDAMTADSWADYADVLGSQSGSLAGAPAEALERALEIEPTHTKALWLKASLAHEQQRYSDSLALWKKLRALLPENSPDTRIIDSNIAEAEQLAGVSPAKAAPAAPVQVSGTVTIDQKLADRVARGTTLFIYAKAADSPGPPLAVLRTSTGTWPVSFKLDDTLAMVPARRLSSFDRVVIEARISRSGQATPAPGDLYGQSDVLRPAEGKKLQLVISREVS